MENVKKKLEELKPKRILDIGTGAGNFIYELNGLYECEYVGVDTSERAIQMAKENFKEMDHISFDVVEENNVPYEDASFDIVCLSNTIHHLSEVDSTFAEMKRLAKKGGYLLFNEMQSDQLTAPQKSHMYVHHFAAKVDRLFGVEHKDTFKRDDIVQLLQQYGPVELVEVDFARQDEMSEEEFNWFKNTIEKIAGRAKDLPEFEELQKEGSEILDYIEKNGYDRATTVIAFVQNQ